MFRPLLALLLLSSLVAAQPLEGPFLVYHAWGDTAVRDLHVSIRADSLVDVFFMRVPGAVEHVVFSLSEHTASPPSTEYSPPAGCQIIEDVAPDGSTGCYVVVRTIGSSGGRWYNLSLMVGPHSSHVIFMGEADPTGYGDTYLTGVSLSPRREGGVIVSGVAWTEWGVEGDGYPFIATFEAGQVIPSATYSPDLGLTPIPVRCLAVDWHQDSVLVLNERGWPPLQILYTLPADSGQQPSYVELACEVPLAVGDTRGERVVGLLPAAGGLQCCEISRTGECTLLGTAPGGGSLFAFQRDHGFAALAKTQRQLGLTRVDTNGTEVQSSGILYECDTLYVIPEADLFIGDDGRIAVVWTERYVGWPVPSMIYLATIGWDTPLDLGEPRFVPHPSCHSLSASPNPFNSSVQIEYTLPRAETVTLSVFNVLGQKVITLHDGLVQAGSHSMMWLPQTGGGVYFLNLRTPSGAKTAKVLYAP